MAEPSSPGRCATWCRSSPRPSAGAPRWPRRSSARPCRPAASASRRWRCGREAGRAARRSRRWAGVGAIPAALVRPGATGPARVGRRRPRIGHAAVRRGGVHRRPARRSSTAASATRRTGPRSAARRARVRLAIRRARLVVALWPGAADALMRLYGLSGARVEVIPNGVPADAFTPTPPEGRPEARRSAGGGARRRPRCPTEPLVAYLGALSPEKDPALAVEAMAMLPSAQLVVAGRGPLADELRRPGPGGGRGPGAPGRARSPSRPGCWPRPTRSVLPSRTEGIPAVAIEAGLAGLPVVATTVGGDPRGGGRRRRRACCSTTARPEAMAEALRVGRSIRRRGCGHGTRPPASAAWPGSASTWWPRPGRPLLAQCRGYGALMPADAATHARAPARRSARRAVKHAAELVDLVRPSGPGHRRADLPPGRSAQLDRGRPARGAVRRADGRAGRVGSGRSPSTTPSSCWPRPTPPASVPPAAIRSSSPSTTAPATWPRWPRPILARHGIPATALRGHRLRRPGPRRSPTTGSPLSWAELRRPGRPAGCGSSGRTPTPTPCSTGSTGPRWTTSSTARST